MNSPEERSAAWYQQLAAALENPMARQQLLSLLQTANTNPQAVPAMLGTPDPMEIRRFLQLADALLRGQSLSMEMMEGQRQLQQEHLKMQSEQAVTTAQTINHFKAGMRSALNEAESGYRITKWMYLTLFILGIGLVVTAVVTGLLGQNTVMSATLAVIGGASTVATLLFGQQKALESSRGDLMQLEIAVFSWLDNIVRLNAGVTMIAQNTPVTPALLQQIWEHSRGATTEVMELVQKYCESHSARERDQAGGTKDAAK